MKKIIAAVLTAFLGITALTSCGDKAENSSESTGNMIVGGDKGIPSDYNITGEDMEYGASIVELKPQNNENVRVMIGFDKRYFSEEEYGAIYRITDYIAAMNENDHELFKEIFYDGYLDYAAGQTSIEDADTYIDTFEASLTESLGEDFEIDYIDVSACYDSSDNASASDFERTDSVLVQLTGDDSILDKVDYRRVVEIGGNTTYKTPKGNYLFTNHERAFMLCIYRIDGQYYIF